MRIHVETHPMWHVYDLDKNELVRNAIWVDDETGEAEEFLQDRDGNFFVDELTGQPAKAIRKGRFKLLEPGDRLPSMI